VPSFASLTKTAGPLCAPRSRCSLRCYGRPGGTERPAPFNPTRFSGPTVVVGGPAGFSVAPPCDRRRDTSAEGLGSRQLAWLVSGPSPRSSAVARARNAREGGAHEERLHERSERSAARRGASRQPPRGWRGPRRCCAERCGSIALRLQSHSRGHENRVGGGMIALR
jgi:hypothetical protein